MIALFFRWSPSPCLLSQLFQGKIVEAVTSCSRAVELCERDENNTPDTDALGQVMCFVKPGVLCSFATATHACRVQTVLLLVGIRMCACVRVRYYFAKYTGCYCTEISVRRVSVQPRRGTGYGNRISVSVAHVTPPRQVHKQQALRRWQEGAFFHSPALAASLSSVVFRPFDNWGRCRCCSKGLVMTRKQAC